MKRKYISLYFPLTDSGGGARNVCVAFGDDETDIFESAREMGTAALKRAINISSYWELKEVSKIEHRTASALIKARLREILSGSRGGFGDTDADEIPSEAADAAACPPSMCVSAEIESACQLSSEIDGKGFRMAVDFKRVEAGALTEEMLRALSALFSLAIHPRAEYNLATLKLNGSEYRLIDRVELPLSETSGGEDISEGGSPASVFGEVSGSIRRLRDIFEKEEPIEAESGDGGDEYPDPVPGQEERFSQPDLFG